MTTTSLPFKSLPVDNKIAAQIFWSFAWRAIGALFGFLLFAIVIFSVLTGLLVALGLFGFAFLGPALEPFSPLLYLVMSVPAGIAAMKIVLKKKFSKFRIVVVPVDRAS